MFVRIHIGPARVPIIIRTPWTAFSAKEMRVRGGPGEDYCSIEHQEEGRFLHTRDPGGVGEVPDALLGELPGEIENHHDSVNWSSEIRLIHFKYTGNIM